MMAAKTLLERLSAQETTAQSELFNRFNSRLFVYFRLRIKGEEHLEDLVQEVFASFFDGIQKNKVTAEHFIAPFIFGIAKRVMYNYFYKQKRNANIQKKGEETLTFSYDFEENDRLQDEALKNTLEHIINELPKVDQVILHEFYLKENDISTVAKQIKKTKHYVSVRKERALKKLKSEILKRKDILYM